MLNWHATDQSIWQGRNDLAEASNALRIFQTLTQSQHFTPEAFPDAIALLGFQCDEGVKLNQGRAGAEQGPDHIRRALANLASHAGHDRLVDLGNISAQNISLDEAQLALSSAVKACQVKRMRTLVFGGGHETAFAHGHGLYHAFPEHNIGIINFDAHLDLRSSPRATSGTPFRQLAQYCQDNQRPFNYTCVGASLAANTQALVDEAERLQATVIWDTECEEARIEALHAQIQQSLDRVDKIYLTIDLDVLPAWQMPAVSAPAPLGMPINLLLQLIKPICQSGKLQAADLVEFSPPFDINGQGAKVAARLAWQIAHWWRLSGE
ncbi:formimidoylglutamase [Pragia fontium]|uniref:Formimidoylglutamase n=1 Tax=Pragia fontium TaxID=82985 RepID=A0ABQ5LJN2_9GAMM|nr:formimidoylglutamase [Pragia fontium]GKX63599.1 formimidoylglutamase [Pragia fontium]